MDLFFNENRLLLLVKGCDVTSERGVFMSDCR